MGDLQTTDFSAKEPALGYYYQIRYSLYLLLKAREKSFETEISVEKLDDIAIENINSTNLYQTKLHINSIANLTDSSPDLWKTIRVWSNAILKGEIDPKRTIFTLITTASSSKNSISYELCKDSENRNNSNIVTVLEKVTKESVNKTNEAAYKDFNLLSTEQKQSLVEKIRILDSSLDIEEVKEKTINELRLSTTQKKLLPFYERLEGWWFSRCINHLFANKGNILFKEVQYKIDEIREQFTKDNLPIDVEDIIVDDDEIEKDNRVFIKQLRAVSIGKETLKNAISDYRRTFKQRSRWIRDELLNPSEEEKYEEKLINDWRLKFGLMKDEIASEVEEDLKCEGKTFYTSFYVKTIPQIFIREKVTDGFIIRGSCHMLSDKKRIGWHPNFDKCLEGD